MKTSLRIIICLLLPGGLIYLAILASRRFWQHYAKGI